MREPEQRSLEYCGFSKPRDFDEIQFELLGLQNLIKRAEERISLLNQSSFLANLAVNNKAEELGRYFDKEGQQNDKDNLIKEES